MADGARPLLQGSGASAKLGVIVEIEGRVLGWDAVGAHHAGPRKVKLRQIGWTHWKTKDTQPVTVRLNIYSRFTNSEIVTPILMET